MKKYFGTDGIRGLVDQDIDVILCLNIANSYAKYILDHNLPRILFLGTDTRESKHVLKAGILSGLLSCGIDVIDLGIVPTGMISFLVAHHVVAGGLMITASHNPPDMNGIKFFDQKGQKISIQIEEEIEENLSKDISCHATNKGKVIAGKKYRKEYLHATQSLSKQLHGYKIVLDCANGSAAKIAPCIFTKLGAEVIALNCGQQGHNINVACGAVYPQKLFQQLVEHSADIAFAYDGDADRLVVVLKDGRVLDGDDLLYVFATYENASAVVGTVMTNGGLDYALASNNIKLYRTAVGDRNVLECMQKQRCLLGAESSGHLCHLKYNLSCDGIMNSVYIAKYLLENKVVLPKKFPMLTKNVPLSPMAQVQANLVDWAELVKPFEDEWGARVLVRVSGTEPKLRIMLEEENGCIEEHMSILEKMIIDQLNLL